MRTLTFILLAACATSAHAQFNQTYTTCGTNHVTQMEAGAISLPNDDFVIEVDTGTPQYPFSGIAVEPVTPGLDLFMGICDVAPGPVSPCSRLLDYNAADAPEVMPALWRGHYHIIVEAVNTTGPTCGQFRLIENLPLD